MRAVACLLLAALACAAELARADARPASAADGHSVVVPVREASGESERMAVHWFLPPGTGPFPVVLFSHGRDPSAARRAAVTVGISRAQLLFWLSRGVAVVAPVRPGYGAHAGADVEDDGMRVDDAGRCLGRAEFGKSTVAALRAVDATLRWLRDQPWADAGHVMLVGQSVGGLVSVAAGSYSPPGVVGVVNFAGGAGGNPERAPGSSCEPAQLETLFADYGRTTTVPSLWVYALNDQFWGAEEPRAWHEAFARGGSPTTFVQTPALTDGDGHGLWRQAPALWAPAVDDFLGRLGNPWDAASTPRPVLRLDAADSCLATPCASPR
jgi:dienelactone hydrolase